MRTMMPRRVMRGTRRARRVIRLLRCVACVVGGGGRFLVCLSADGPTLYFRYWRARDAALLIVSTIETLFSFFFIGLN